MDTVRLIIFNNNGANSDKFCFDFYRINPA